MRQMTRLALATLVAAPVTLAAVGAQNPTPASAAGIIAQTPCRFTTFEEQSAFARRFYAKDEFEAAKNSASIECLRIQYLSDGLKVVGILVKPRDPQGIRHSVIIYNRGGLADIGKLDTPNILDFFELAAKGFVVLASQYRGNDGGEGREEFGGADVNDVTNLVAVAAGLPYVDSKNVFLYGLSRGGMMTMLALERGASVNAAVVVGALLDLEDGLEFTRRRAPGIADRVTKLIPDYASRGAAALRDRSAMNRPEKVNVPLLIIHGGDDEEVPVSQALAFATKLSALHKPYELVVYANEIHEVLNNRRDRDARIVAWFRRFLR